MNTKHQDGTYNRAVYLTASLTNPLVGKEYNLVWSEHVRERLLQNFLADPSKVLLALPNPFPLHLGELVEVSVLYGEPWKVVARRPFDVSRDICIVFNVRSGSVRTVWFNSRNDRHITLDRSKFIQKP